MNQSVLSIKTELVVYMSISFTPKKVNVKEFGSHDCGDWKSVGQANRLETQDRISVIIFGRISHPRNFNFALQAFTLLLRVICFP